MSDNQPPQGPWQGPNPQDPYQQGPYQQGPYQQGPYQQGGGDWEAMSPEQGQRPKRRRKGLIVGAVATAAAVLLGGGGIVAWSTLSGGGPQPAEALPESTLAYARIDLDPSASQKVNLVRLLRRVPEFSERTGIDSDTDDLRKRFFDSVLDDDECDVNYDDDIAPWIGARAAVAAVPHEEEPTPVFALQTSDADAAKSTIDELAECGNETNPGVATVGDYLVLAEEQSMAEEFADDAEQAPLSEDGTFVADMDALGEKGVASFWVDGNGFTELAESAGESAPVVDKIDFKSAAGAIRAGSDHIELATVAQPDKPLTTDASSDVGQLPESTVFAASLAGGGEYVDGAWSTFTESMSDMMYDFEYQLDEFEDQTGVSLPEDLTTLFGQNITIAADGQGLDSLAGGMPDLTDLRVGIKMTTDPDDASDLFGRINDRLASQRGPELATKETGEGLVVATNEGYADKLSEDGSLGDTEAFQAVVPNAEDAAAVVYLDVNKATEVAEQVAAQSGDSTEVLDNLEPVRAVGVSASSAEDGHNSVTVRVGFD